MRADLYRILAPLLLIFLLPVQGYSGPPVQSTLLYREGAELFKKGDIESAELKFTESVKLSPSYSLAYYGLGRVYLFKEDKIDDAITHLRKSVELDAGLARGYFYLGLAELLAEKHIEALHSFENAYSRDSRFIESLYNIAVIHEHLGNSFKAFVYFRRYINETEK